jgi:hypothetical protein
MTPSQKARLYWQMGRMLVKGGRYSEADPILRDCRMIASGIDDAGDLAACWTESGESAAYRGWCSLARMAFKNAEQIAPTDDLSGKAHELAEWWIDALNRASANGGNLVLPADGIAHSQDSSIQCSDEDPVGVIQ